MSVTLRGVTGIIGRHAAIAQKQPQLPAMMYMRHSFAVAQRRQEQQRLTVRAASTSAKAPTTMLTEKEAMDLLNEQRSLRPNSPHLTIYEPQLTWYGSIANRITGVGLSACKLRYPQMHRKRAGKLNRQLFAAAVLYVWGISYLALPYTPIGEILSSAHMVHYAALAPFWLKLTIKAPLAAAASYHTWNGFRHLAWDSGYCEYE